MHIFCLQLASNTPQMNPGPNELDNLSELFNFIDEEQNDIGQIMDELDTIPGNKASDSLENDNSGNGGVTKKVRCF